MKSKIIMTVSIIVGLATAVILTTIFKDIGLDDSLWSFVPAVFLGTLTHWVLSGKGLTSKSDIDINRIESRLTWWYWLVGSTIFGIITFLLILVSDKASLLDWYWQVPIVILAIILPISFIAYFSELYDSKLKLILADKSRALLNKKGYDLLSHKRGFIVIKAEDFNSKYEDMSVYYNSSDIKNVYNWAMYYSEDLT